MPLVGTTRPIPPSRPANILIGLDPLRRKNQEAPSNCASWANALNCRGIVGAGKPGTARADFLVVDAVLRNRSAPCFPTCYRPKNRVNLRIWPVPLLGQSSESPSIQGVARKPARDQSRWKGRGNRSITGGKCGWNRRFVASGRTADITCKLAGIWRWR
jgi:hypothetical protein